MSQSTVSRWPIIQLEEPGSRQSGFVVFAIAYLISLVGTALFLDGGITPAANTLLYREVGNAMAALGLSIAPFGIVLLLPPIGRLGGSVALLGGIGFVVAIGMFTTVYPTQSWALVTTFEMAVIGLYTAGVGTIAGIATVVPYVTGMRRLLDEPAGAKAGDRLFLSHPLGRPSDRRKVRRPEDRPTRARPTPIPQDGDLGRRRRDRRL